MIDSNQLLARLTKRFASLTARPEMWGTVDMLEATYLSYLDVAVMILNHTLIEGPAGGPDHATGFFMKEYSRCIKHAGGRPTTHHAMVKLLYLFHYRLAFFTPELTSTIPAPPEIPDGTAQDDQPPTV